MDELAGSRPQGQDIQTFKATPRLWLCTSGAMHSQEHADLMREQSITLDLTIYSLPRYLLIVFAFDGDSTITKDLLAISYNFSHLIRALIDQTSIHLDQISTKIKFFVIRIYIKNTTNCNKNFLSFKFSFTKFRSLFDLFERIFPDKPPGIFDTPTLFFKSESLVVLDTITPSISIELISSIMSA